MHRINRINAWFTRHAIQLMGVSLIVFFLMLGYAFYVRGEAIDLACNSANDVREQIRELMESFKARVRLDTEITELVRERQLAKYDEIINGLPDTRCRR